MAPTAATTARPDLPELPLEGWEPTKTTLHLWAQIVGKVRLASTSPLNHWWHVPLYLDVRGLTTRRMHAPVNSPPADCKPRKPRTYPQKPCPIQVRRRPAPL